MGKETRTRKLIDIIQGFSDKNILVIGDSILDQDSYLEPLGWSLETPTPKFKHINSRVLYGGAANVVENILELGGKCKFITITGDDENSISYEKFKHKNLEFFPIVEKNRKTTVKHRFFVERGGVKYKSYQIDYFDNREINEKEKVLEKIKDIGSYIDTVILVDYRHGMMSKYLINKIKTISKEKNIITIVSSQVSESKSNHKDYSGVDLIVMNLKEAKCVYPKTFLKSDGKLSGLNNLGSILNSNICVTLGNKGSSLYIHDTKEDSFYTQDAIKVKEVDSCGAGDSFLAAFSLADYKKNPNESLYLANCFAGLSVLKYGTEIPSKKSLIDLIKNEKKTE